MVHKRMKINLQRHHHYRHIFEAVSNIIPRTHLEVIIEMKKNGRKNIPTNQGVCNMLARLEAQGYCKSFRQVVKRNGHTIGTGYEVSYWVRV